MSICFPSCYKNKSCKHWIVIEFVTVTEGGVHLITLKKSGNETTIWDLCNLHRLLNLAYGMKTCKVRTCLCTESRLAPVV